MKIVAFNGSPSGKSSATNRILEAFLEGAETAGAEIMNYQLIDYQIEQWSIGKVNSSSSRS